ncbi:NUDIX domain-containing protein [Plantactinospora sonchi]|uniref:NUDIX domain-containing protein n=1 Tax=Plantactinospora sonchi TaxID=1544735 RepID=A0ABU7S4J9_9ACTN
MTPRGYGPSAAFCPRCAAALPGPAPTACTGCGYQLFVNARPTAGLVILDRPLAVPDRDSGAVVRRPAGVDVPQEAVTPGSGVETDGPRFLALRRAAAPMIGRWETPGGFCDGWEHPADAAVREAREELGVDLTLGDYLGMYVGSYEYQGEELPVLDVFFLATLGDQVIDLNRDEATEATWFPLLTPPPLAFGTMDAAIRTAARRLFR